jgi:anti-anti-sigma factor
MASETTAAPEIVVVDDTVRLIGEHDLTTAPELRDVLVELSGRARLVVDLTQAEFVDSRIVAEILGARDGGGRLSVLVAPGTAPARVLEVLELQAVLNVRAPSSFEDLGEPARTVVYAGATRAQHGHDRVDAHAAKKRRRLDAAARGSQSVAIAPRYSPEA